MKIIETNIKWVKPLSKRPRTDYIVLHHAEASKCTVEQVDSWHKQKDWAGIGYHFFVRKDGTIYRGRPLDTMGAHVSGMNSVSIGICAEGKYMTEIMPDAQKKSICELLVYLKDNYYPAASIVGHREIGESDCPGSKYPLTEIKNNYRNIANSVKEYTKINDILWELKHRGVLSNTDLWLKKANEDKDIYWYLRKLCQYIRTKTTKESEKVMYTKTHDIVWDLWYRRVISDMNLWTEKATTNSNVYDLLKKSLDYVRTH